MWDTAVEQTGGASNSRRLMAINYSGSSGQWHSSGCRSSKHCRYPRPGLHGRTHPGRRDVHRSRGPDRRDVVVQGFGAAVVLLVWTVVYQQLENFFLSPRLAAKTMTINGVPR